MDTESSVQEQSGGEVTTGTEAQVVEATEKPVSGDSEKVAKLEALLKKVDGIEKATSSFQSEKDKSVKRASELEAENKRLTKALNDLRKQYADDPEFSSTLDRTELEGYRSREKVNADLQRQQQEMAEWGEFIRSQLDDIGVKHDHPELAHAARGARSGAEASRMILAKAKVIKQKEGGKKVSKDDLAQLKEELLAELRREQGLDTSDNIPPASEAAGGAWTPKKVRGLSPEDIVNNSAEIAKLQLTI